LRPGLSTGVRFSEVGSAFGPALAQALKYPTNFVKVIDGRNTNVYHPLDVPRLRELAEISGLDALTQWADRWDEVLCSWGDMPIYNGMSAWRTKTPGGGETEDVGCRVSASVVT
jgi:hypothetical protein